MPTPRRPLARLLPALLLVGVGLLAAAPTAQAHFCVEQTWSWTDPEGCDAHDCGDLRDDGPFHAGHIVIHGGDGWTVIHGCGPALHYGTDGKVQDPYVCITYPRPACLAVHRPILA